MSRRRAHGRPSATDFICLEGLFEDVESALGGLARDRQGREKHEDVFFRGDEQAIFAAGVADPGGVVFIFDLDPDGEPFAADGRFAFEAHLRKPREEVLAEFGGVFEKACSGGALDSEDSPGQRRQRADASHRWNRG